MPSFSFFQILAADWLPSGALIFTPENGYPDESIWVRFRHFHVNIYDQPVEMNETRGGCVLRAPNGAGYATRACQPASPTLRAFGRRCWCRKAAASAPRAVCWRASAPVACCCSGPGDRNPRRGRNHVIGSSPSSSSGALHRTRMFSAFRDAAAAQTPSKLCASRDDQSHRGADPRRSQPADPTWLTSWRVRHALRHDGPVLYNISRPTLDTSE